MNPLNRLILDFDQDEWRHHSNSAVPIYNAPVPQILRRGKFQGQAYIRPHVSWYPSRDSYENSTFYGQFHAGYIFLFGLFSVRVQTLCAGFTSGAFPKNVQRSLAATLLIGSENSETEMTRTSFIIMTTIVGLGVCTPSSGEKFYIFVCQ